MGKGRAGDCCNLAGGQGREGRGVVIMATITASSAPLTHCVLDPSDGVFGRFDLAALGGCHTLNVCYVMS